MTVPQHQDPKKIQLTPAHRAALTELAKWSATTEDVGRAVLQALKRPSSPNRCVVVGDKILESLAMIGLVSFTAGEKSGRVYKWKITHKGMRHVPDAQTFCDFSTDVIDELERAVG